MKKYLNVHSVALATKKGIVYPGDTITIFDSFSKDILDGINKLVEKGYLELVKEIAEPKVDTEVKAEPQKGPQVVKDKEVSDEPVTESAEKEMTTEKIIEEAKADIEAVKQELENEKAAITEDNDSAEEKESTDVTEVKKKKSKKK